MIFKRFFSWLGRDSGPELHDGAQSGYPDSYAGNAAAPVSFDTAMAVSSFWASARLLSETVAAMPITCYSTDGDVKTENTNHKLWRLLNYMPNRYQTRTEYFETLMLNLVTTGNAYSMIQRGPSGDILSLIPLMSAQTTPYLTEDGSVIYNHTTPKGNVRVYAASSIWHVKLYGSGIVGLSPLAYARQSLGIAIATESRVTALAKTGGKRTGILTIDKVLSETQREAVRRNFSSLTEGPSDKLFILEAGMNYTPTSLSPSDMELLSSRRYQTEDIARFMGVPSVLINDTQGSTVWGSGIEQIINGFLKLNLRPYLERLESSIERHLVPTDDWDKIELAFDFDDLLKPDLSTRLDSYSKGVNGGILSPNEARAIEGYQPKQGGDDIFLNRALVAARYAGRPKETT